MNTASHRTCKQWGPARIGVDPSRPLPSEGFWGHRLESLAVDTLIITGLTTSRCVRPTAMDTLLHNLDGTVVRESIGRHQRQHDAMFDINAKLDEPIGQRHPRRSIRLADGRPTRRCDTASGSWNLLLNVFKANPSTPSWARPSADASRRKVGALRLPQRRSSAL